MVDTGSISPDKTIVPADDLMRPGDLSLTGPLLGLTGYAKAADHVSYGLCIAIDDIVCFKSSNS